MSARQPQLSEWINASTPPTIVGVYERRFSRYGAPYYALWDGTQWHASWWNPTDAAAETSHSGHRAASWWRGLRYDPALSQVLAS